jgi:hypothetical protein
MKWTFKSSNQPGQTCTSGKEEGTWMPWMSMQFEFYPQNKRRKENCIRKGSASSARNKDTSHRTAPKRNRTQIKGQPKCAQHIK